MKQCHFGLQDFYRNFSNDPKVKIPWVRRDLSGPRVLTMEWIDGIRCTDPAAIRASGMDVAEFIRCGVVTGLRQLLEVSICLLLCCAVLCCAVLCCAVLCCAVLCCAVLGNVLLAADTQSCICFHAGQTHACPQHKALSLHVQSLFWCWLTC